MQIRDKKEQATRVKVSASLLASAFRFCSKDDARRYLRGVYIEKHEDGALLVATDGHRLVMFLDPNGKVDGGDEMLVAFDADLLAAAKKALSKGTFGSTVEVVSDPETGQVDWIAKVRTSANRKSTSQSITTGKLASLDGASYPDYRRVIPKMDKLQSGNSIARFNASYIADIVTSFPKVTKFEHGEYKVIPNREGGLPIDIRFSENANEQIIMSAQHGGIKAAWVQMPLRTEKNESTCQDFFWNPKPKEKVEAETETAEASA